MNSNKFAIAIGFVIILLIIGWFLYNNYQSVQQAEYWQKLNTSTEYTGNGYKIIFPCSDIKNITLIQNNDYNHTEDSCSFFGGEEHNQIDIYTVSVKQELSSNTEKERISDCADYVDETTNTTVTKIYNETRTIDHKDIFFCGWDSGVLNAKIRNNNIVYTLNVMPYDKKTTYKKLNELLSTFQFIN